MLRWSDELRIGLCADRIVWVRLARGLGLRVTEKRVIDVELDDGQPQWKAALAVLAGALKVHAGKATASIVLSNRFVRYAVVPWHEQLMKRDERLIQARQCFRQIYADLAAKWSIGLSETRYRKPVLASAIDQELLEGLRQACKAAGIPLVSLSPYLTTAHRHFSSAPGAAGDAWKVFCVVEPDAICALSLDGENVRGVSNQRLREDWPTALGAILMQNAGEAEAPAATHVWAPEHPGAESGLAAGMKRLSLTAMNGFSPITDRQFAMALTGA